MKAYLFSLNPEANIANQWDYGFLKDFLEDNNFDIENVSKLPKTDKAIVVIPARHHVGYEIEVLLELNKIDHVVLFLMGDEEAVFEVEVIKHDSIEIWVQNPHIGRHDAYHKLGTGYPTHFRNNLPEGVEKGYLDIFFAGQATHQRRTELLNNLIAFQRKNKKTVVIPTQGFTKGESPKDYYLHMFSAKIAPAPSGAIIPDSFRLFEALECMTIPIADERTASGEIMYYWDWLFGEITPFPKTTDWQSLSEVVHETLENWPHNMHKQTAWWIKYKRDFKNKVLDQLGVEEWPENRLALGGDTYL